ncbi:hypothetical protein ACPPVU_03010 [Mucilaginibacter sp. McL0603]|uniref:hypothetical protein n=1 Tax=Mucilaginibacter sp. McL0603 TaxID=3415670 RepID=UPI003CEA352E
MSPNNNKQFDPEKLKALNIILLQTLDNNEYCNALYNIITVNASGQIVKTATTSQINWQANVSGLLPGTYVLQVVNSSDNSLVGKGTFVKL